MLTLASAVMVGCGGKKEPEKDPKDDEVIVKPEPVVLPEGVSFDEKKYPDVFGFIQIPNATQPSARDTIWHRAPNPPRARRGTTTTIISTAIWTV